MNLLNIAQVKKRLLRYKIKKMKEHFKVLITTRSF